jgi:hypothetical protein
MARKVAGQSLPIVVEEPPPAHDAGLVTAHGPGGGFCVNRPRTNLIGIGALLDDRVPGSMFGNARSGRRRIRIRVAKGGAATHQSIEFSIRSGCSA